MKIRLNEDYYLCCCDWCDTENRVLWANMQEGSYCGACHRPIYLSNIGSIVATGTIAAGLH